MRQDLHKLPEVHTGVIVALCKEGVYDAVTERIDGQFWDPQEVLARQSATVTTVKRCESGVKAFDLVRRDYGGDLKSNKLMNIG